VPYTCANSVDSLLEFIVHHIFGTVTTATILFRAIIVSPASSIHTIPSSTTFMYFRLDIVFFFHAEDGIRYRNVTGVQTCALPICEADLTQERPKKKQTLSQEEAYQTQPELSKYHTYDLLLLLSYLREQRSTAYKTMQSVRKAPNEVKTSRNDYDELNEYGQEFYREAT